MGSTAAVRRKGKSVGSGPRRCFLSARTWGRAGAFRIAPLTIFILWSASLRAAAYDWPQLNGDPQHSGNNTHETVLGASNVASLLPLFLDHLPAIADGAPALLAAVATTTGTRDVLFVTTLAGHILALDAHTGAVLWSRQYPAGSCRINLGSNACYTTSSPAIDPNRLYVYAYGLDGFVHKYQVGDGTEIVGGGWPELATLKGFNEKGSSSLSVATASSGTSYLYVTNGGYPGDAGDYQGHVTAINLTDGSQKVFNALCSDQAVHFLQTPGTPDCPHVQSAIWARVGVVYDGVTDRIYMATGNGTFDANQAGREWGDSVFSLHPDGTGSGGNPLDSYTPTNFQQLDSSDADLGSTAPAILPASGFAGRLAVQSGKDANLRLIDLTNLSGQGGPGHVGGELQILAVPQGCLVLSAPAVWINPADSSTWVFVTNSCGSSGTKLTFPGGVPTLSPQWQNGFSGFSPLVANNVLYLAGGGVARALDPTTGNSLWNGAIGGTHWQSPVVANGVLYVSDQSAQLTAFSLGPAILAASPGGGPPAGGTATTLFGGGFQTGAAVSFGASSSPSVSVINANTIRATAPAHAAGAVDVTVTNPGNRTATLTNGFTYGGVELHTVTPCRLVDTRGPAGPLAGPALVGGADRTFVLAGACGIPAAARALAVNIVVTQPSGGGHLTLYPPLTTLPAVSTLNFSTGQTRANNAIVALGLRGDFTVRCASAGADVIIDVAGYFQ